MTLSLTYFTGIQFDDKKNYKKIIHDVGNKKKQRSQIFGKIINFRIYFPKSIIKVNIKSFTMLHKV